jgi:hypothetical protein
MTDGHAFVDDSELKPQIEENWRFVFQERLFGEQPAINVDERMIVGKDRPRISPRQTL